MKPLFKAPAEVRSFEVDLSGQTNGAALAAIASRSVIPRGQTPGPALVIDGATVSGQRVRLTLSGGTDGEMYRIDVTATDAAGEIVAGSVEVCVINPGWTRSDGSAGYLSAEEAVIELGYEEAHRLTDELGTGRIDTARLFAALEDGAALIDAYLGARYKLPLDTVPGVVKLLAKQLLRPRLVRVPGDDLANLEKRAIKVLEDIRDGRLQLPSASAPAPAPADEVLIEAPGRIFTAESLAGF